MSKISTGVGAKSTSGDKCGWKILILTDSRGRGLENFTEDILKNCDIEVVLQPGAKIEQLFQKAKNRQQQSSYDCILVQAGICNFTTKTYERGLYFLKYYRDNQTNSVIEYIEQARGDLSNLLIATIAPASLKRYFVHSNGHEPEGRQITDLANQQQDLLDDLEIVNNHITKLNIELGLRTVDLHRQVFGTSLRRKKSRRPAKFQDTHLVDGVHPDEALKAKWNRRICYSILSQLRQLVEIQQEEKNQGTEGSSRTDSETETWNFKRPRKSEEGNSCSSLKPKN